MPVELGQHLLCDESVINRVIKAAELTTGDHVFDAGAGTGALTRPIARTISPGGRVYAVDVDPEMLDALRQISMPGVSVVASDLLRWPLPELNAVVANPPFKIAAPLIERIAKAHVPRAVFVVPRELADRLAAKPGTQHYGKLTIKVGLHAAVDDFGFVPRRAFTPPPNITSGIIRLRARDDVKAWDPEMLNVVLDAAWASWNRKTRRALGPVPRQFRIDSGAFTRMIEDAGWADEKVSTLPPEAFAAMARHLSDAVRAKEAS